MMMGMQTAPARLFYDFCLDDHVPDDHLLRRIDQFIDLEKVRTELRPFYSSIGRPSIDPELMMRMLIVGYCMGIRSERRLCEEIHLNLAYRWFCHLGLDGRVPDHSTFSRNRHGRFRQSDILPHLFETVVQRCLREGLVGGEGFAVDASLIAADANKQRSVPGDQWRVGVGSDLARATRLATRLETDFGFGSLGLLCLAGDVGNRDLLMFDKLRAAVGSTIDRAFDGAGSPRPEPARTGRACRRFVRRRLS
jgi:transposase